MLRILDEISIPDPRSGLSEAFKQVQSLKEKHKQETLILINLIEVFDKKVIEYYQE